MQQVYLFDTESLGMIVPKATGVSYIHQVGGHANLHRSMEGYYVPLRLEANELSNYFHRQFCGHSMAGLSQDEADAVDTILEAYELLPGLRIDTSKLKMSVESWVLIKIDEPEKLTRWIRNAEVGTGVLTWRNAY